MILLIWGTGFFKSAVNSMGGVELSLPGLDKMIAKMPPVAPGPTPEAATFLLHLAVIHGHRHVYRSRTFRLCHGLHSVGDAENLRQDNKTLRLFA